MADEAETITNHERETWNRCAKLYADELTPVTPQGYQLIVDTGHILRRRGCST